MTAKFACVSCGYLVQNTFGKGETCPVCGWQDYLLQLKDPFCQGAIQTSLFESQRQFLRSGSANKRLLEEYVRSDWRPIIMGFDEFSCQDLELENLSTPDELYYWKPSFWNARRRGAKIKDLLELAHKFSIFNHWSIKQSDLCACFRCCSVFEATNIEKWCDRGLTAVCPKCGIDAILASSCGFPLTVDFLNRMNSRWFHDKHRE